MKFSLPLAVIAIAAVADAAALPEAEADPNWCLFQGQSCWKRNAEAEADPNWCLFSGQSCWKDKREAEASPEAQGNWCTFPGQSCWKDKREPEASAEAQGNWCTFPGQSCWKVKRAAEAFMEAIHAGGPAIKSREAEFSNMPGRAAFIAKRQINAVAALVAASQKQPVVYYDSLDLPRNFAPDQRDDGSSTKLKRDPAAAENDKRFCNSEGQTCWKVTRAAEAVVRAIGDTIQNEIRDVPFEPLAHSKREPDASAEAQGNWCTFPGQSCWKREPADVEARCNAPDGLCTAAKRDLHAMYNAARSVLEAQK